MDDLTSKIAQILGDPKSMEMVKDLAQSLGTNMNQDDNTAENNDKNGSRAANDESSAIGGNDLSNMLTGISNMPISPQQLTMVMNIMSKLKSEQNDDRAKLLLALKPHLSAERQKKADNAVKMLKIVSLLPIIKDTGLFDLF